MPQLNSLLAQVTRSESLCMYDETRRMRQLHFPEIGLLKIEANETFLNAKLLGASRLLHTLALLPNFLLLSVYLRTGSAVLGLQHAGKQRLFGRVASHNTSSIIISLWFSWHPSFSKYPAASHFPAVTFRLSRPLCVDLDLQIIATTLKILQALVLSGMSLGSLFTLSRKQNTWHLLLMAARSREEIRVLLTRRQRTGSLSPAATSSSSMGRNHGNDGSAQSFSVDLQNSRSVCGASPPVWPRRCLSSFCLASLTYLVCRRQRLASFSGHQIFRGNAPGGNRFCVTRVSTRQERISVRIRDRGLSLQTGRTVARDLHPSLSS